MLSFLRRSLALFLALAALVPLAGQAEAAFPGRPGLIAFQSTRAGGLGIWLVEPDGGGLRQFTVGGGGDRKPRLRQYAPAFDPSGRRVAYVGSRDAGDRTLRNLFVKGVGVRAVSDPGRQVFRRPSPRAIESVAFAPGGRLVFSAVPRRGGPDYELFTVRLDGSGLRQLTRNRIQDIEPTVSSKGLIAFTQMLKRDKPPLALFGRSNIALIRPGRDGPRPLTGAATNGGEDRSPSFSPSGQRIVYERNLSRYSKQEIREAAVGSNRSRTIVANSRWYEPHNPVFSPAGNRIVFDSSYVSDRYSTNPDLYVIGRDGRGMRFVTGLGKEFDTDPDWGPLP
jgi:Tol biopolymer transport system component